MADSSNSTIRKITPSGVVSTLAGLAESYGSADGIGSAARFDDPTGVAVDGSGNVYVADSWNHTIRKITPSGVVSTLAGLAGFPAARTEPVRALFYRPSGVAVDSSGNVYIADRENHAIRKGSPATAGFVPIVLDVVGLAHYTSELQLTNLGANSATVKLSYTGSIASGKGDAKKPFLPASRSSIPTPSGSSDPRAFQSRPPETREERSSSPHPLQASARRSGRVPIRWIPSR